MVDLLSYACLSLAGIFVVSSGVSAVWFRMLISEVITRNEEASNTLGPDFNPYAVWDLGKMIRFAERIDKNMARKMKRLRLVAVLSCTGALAFFWLAAFIGGFQRSAVHF